MHFNYKDVMFENKKTDAVNAWFTMEYVCYSF